MDGLLLLSMTLFFVPLAWASFRFLIRQPLNVMSGLVVLCVVFYLFPALTWMHGVDAPFDYGFGTAGAEVLVDGQVLPLAVCFALTGLLLLGAAWPAGRPLPGAASGRTGIAMAPSLPAHCYHRELLFLLIAVWIGLIVMIRHQSGMTLAELIMPYRKVKADVYGSFYVLYSAIYIPLVIGTTIYLKSDRFRPASLGWFAVAVLITLGTAQRRNVLVVCLYLAALHFTKRRTATRRAADRRPQETAVPAKPRTSLVLRGTILQPNSRRAFAGWMRMACAAIGCLALGPLLWWVRNWFTGLIDPLEELIAPWERQGFFELLFGSASAGFPTFLLVKEWVDADGIQWGVSLLATLSVFIPREIWPDKPAGAELLIQQHFGLETMPSTFLINELYLNAGPLSLPVAFLVGRLLTGVYESCARVGSPQSRMVIVAMFANLVTLFKNGLGPFCVNVVFLVGLSWCAMLPLKRKES